MCPDTERRYFKMTNCIEKKGDIGQIKIEAKPSLVWLSLRGALLG